MLFTNLVISTACSLVRLHTVNIAQKKRLLANIFTLYGIMP